MSKAFDHRKTEYKFHGLTNEELRKHRENRSIEIRKIKREESLNKKRNIPGQEIKDITSDDIIPDNIHNLDSQKLSEMVTKLYSSDFDKILSAVIDFRKMLSKEKNPPIQDVIRCGAVQKFVQILCGDLRVEANVTSKIELIQFEAAWVLTNIASGTSEQTKNVIDAGAVPVFIKLLSHNNLEIREQSIWALGNISGDSPQCRDLVLNSNILESLLSLTFEEISKIDYKISLIRNASWTISNLCRGKPHPDWNRISPALSLLYILLSVNDDETISDSCWALSYMSDISNQSISDIIQAGIIPKLIELLCHKNPSVQTPALRAIGNIVTGDDLQTQVSFFYI